MHRRTMKRARGTTVVQSDDDDDAPLLERFTLTSATAADESSPQGGKKKNKQQPKRQKQQQIVIPDLMKDADVVHEPRASASPGASGLVDPEAESDFLFDKSVRDAMQPSVTSQFRMSWCWPASPTNQADVVCEDGQRTIGPTFIVELRSDPRLRKENRRMALVVNCGERFLFPLLPRPRETAAGKEATLFWRTPQKPYQGQLPPHYAELLVGTVQDLKKVSNIVENLSDSTCSAHGDASLGRDAETENQIKANMGLPLKTFFFQSLPYRTLWLYQFPECLIVSLPHEERLVSLDLKRDSQTTCITPELSTTRIACTGSFRLPHFVVPLDISEVFDRPFLAVGTMGHGVLILLIENGVCVNIVHRIPLLGLSTSMFPVVHICTVFPPLQTENDETNALGTCGVKSTLLSQALEGSILCVSPYENRTVALKCDSAGGDGCGFELPSPTRTLAGFLCSTPYSPPALGPIIATLGGKLFYLAADDLKMSDNESNANKNSRKERKQHYGAFDVVSPEVIYDTTTRPLLGVTPNHFCEGGPVRQKVSHSKYQASFIRHWLCLTTLTHEVLLLDRKVANYVKHSSITIRPPPTSESPIDDTPTPITQIPVVKSRQKKESKDKSKDTPLPQSNTNQDNSIDGMAYPAALEDGITGVSWLQVGDGVLQVLLTHHKNCITVVTWSV